MMGIRDGAKEHGALLCIKIIQDFLQIYNTINLRIIKVCFYQSVIKYMVVHKGVHNDPSLSVHHLSQLQLQVEHKVERQTVGELTKWKTRLFS